MPSSLLLAVHISNGVLSPTWIWLGFAGMILLIVPAMIRVADEEIPRIALLTAAFFLASSLHVKLGPSSVHLLLNGLVGAVLGWRAGLAIPIGLTLQAFLLEHGGLSTIGINSCILTIPALLCAELVAVARNPVRGLRADLLWLLSAFIPVLFLNQVFFSSLLYGVNHSAIPRPSYFGWIWQLVLLIPAIPLGLLLQPFVLKGLLSLKLLSNFTLGCLVGAIGVSLSLLLQSAVILIGGEADWKVVVWIVLVSHLPVLVLESLIVGFSLQFLARVKPDYLHSASKLLDSDQPQQLSPANHQQTHLMGETKNHILLLALVSFLFQGQNAFAHRLDADYTILPDRQIRIEAWFDSGSKPETGKVQVFLPDNQLLTEGTLEAKGLFYFRIDRPATLRIVINPGDGHRKELTIPESILRQAFNNPKKDPVESVDTREVSAFEEITQGRNRKIGFPIRDALIGIGFLLALGAFWLSWRNQILILQLKKQLQTQSIETTTSSIFPPESSGH